MTLVDSEVLSPSPNVCTKVPRCFGPGVFALSNGSISNKSGSESMEYFLTAFTGMSFFDLILGSSGDDFQVAIVFSMVLAAS